MSEIKFIRRQREPHERAGTPVPVAESPPSDSNPPPPAERRHGLRTHVILACLAVASTLSVWFTMSGLGMTWDEAYYFEPHRNAAQFLIDAAQGTRVPGVTPDQYFAQVPELPAVPRLIHGLSGLLFDGSWLAERHMFAPLVAQRLLNGAAHGLNAYLLALLLVPAAGSLPAIAGMLAYATLPHVFAHAHFAATETLMVTMTLLTVLAFLRGLRSLWAVPLAGVAFGLALNTKFNLILLPLPLALWGLIDHRRLVWLPLLGMAAIAPIVWIATWPWLWSDTLTRLWDYLQHFLTHAQTPTWYLGRRWGEGTDSVPWFYPLHILALTTPLPTLLLSAVGLLFCLWPRSPDRREHLFVLLAAIPLAISSAPGAPRYDGTRLFFNALPALALLAGVGCARIGEWFPGAGRDRVHSGVVLALAALMAIPGALAIFISHPHELSHFNELAGGLPGAVRRGFEPVQWCEAVNEPVIEHLNAMLPPGASLMPVALHDQIFTHMQSWGVLRPDIRIVGPPAVSDYHIVQARFGFFGRVEWFLWSRWFPGGSRRFGWPRGVDIPEVPLIAVAPTGQGFVDAVMRELTLETSEITP